jgi:hypothetical protein
LKEKEKMRKGSKVGIIVLLSLLFAYVGVAVYADIQVSVYIRDPLNSSNDAEGLVSGSCWVGEIPLTVSGATAPGAQQTKGYCMNFDRTVYVGSTYPAELTAVMDTAEWKAVSYILTWYHPPANDGEAAANQVAIWRLLNSTRGYDYVTPDWLSTSLDSAGNALAEEVKDKDVVRQGDVFQWIEPVTTNQSALVGNPGETITFKTNLTDASGTSRPGVRIIFSAVLRPDDVELDSTYIHPLVTHTDSNGIAEVNVTIPDDIQNGESIEVNASTKSVWPQLYLDLNDEKRQDLVGIGTTYELTVSTNVCVLASILVVPEVPLGTLTAGAACAFACVFWKKGGHLKKQKIK